MNNTFVALCAIGAEKILGNEIKLLGYKIKDNAPGRVIFLGDEEAIYKTNICLRTADRVFLQLAEYNAEDFDLLFQGAYSVDWENYFRKDVRIIVDKVRIYKSKLNSEHSIQGMVHKAIYKRLGEKWHITTLPESGNVCNIRVYLDNNTARLLLDLSGTALHKRGYRTATVAAPLRETTAATLLQLMLWKRKTPLHDPFCGSGTIAAEALLYAYNIAPGLGRHFAFENLSIYNKPLEIKIRKHAASLIRPDVHVEITGSDIDETAVSQAKINIEHACVMAGRALQTIGNDAKIPRPDFIQSDFTALAAPFPYGLLLCNPPYGERLGDAKDADELYRKMSCLFENFPDWEFGIITPRKEFQECIGHYAPRLKDIKAGNLDTCFYMYTDAAKTGRRTKK